MDVLSLGFICSCILFLSKISTALDTIGPSQSITNSQTLVSSDGRFELGFFRPGTYNNIYLGIWFRNIPGRTVVWVANRSSPTNDSSVELMIDGTGNLVLRGKNSSRVIWSTNSAKRARNPVARLLDSGNLVLLDGANSEDYLWQSFDYPTDTLLPGMKLGWDLTRGLDRRLVSWKSSDDPSPGYFSWEIVRQDNPEGLMWLGSTKYYRSGPWDGIGFSGAPEIRPNPVFTMNFISNNTDLYFIYNFKNKSTLARMVVNQTTNYREASTWNEATQSWVVSASVPRDKCDNYGLCGVYGNCITSDWPNCQCLDKFSPKSPEKWNSMDWTDGCVRNKPLDCGKGDGFVEYVGLKVPDATGSWINGTMNLEECRAKCLQNCSCMAYTNSDVRRRSGCAIWFGDLIDIRQFQEGGQELYIRMNSAEVEGKSSQKVKIALTSSAAIVMVLGMVIVTYLICKRKAKKKHVDETEANWQNTQKNDGQKDDLELPLFELATIAIATNKFSEKNKLGEGGFGVVYRGVMVDGLEIAVKRLSRSSGQGLNEFKTEVLLITKLQHRNLVKLLGCCIQGDEKMLVYEYMPNKSLDFFLFDQTRSNLLDWSKRYNIICGIARGLLYLHQDSILRIIHRDLKASNVLLDKDMNPKISDFGLAKTFKGDQTEGNTSRVVGTYGYMAPEYATDGLFSVKSDVFSFGILVLEIVSGKKSRGFSRPNHNQSLIGYGWKVWKEGKSLEIIDPSTIESCDLTEVLRCINISLLCTQQRPEDRPSMASVVLMLGSESSSLPQPIEPGFLKEGDPLYEKFLSRETGTFSVNGLTTSILEAR